MRWTLLHLALFLVIACKPPAPTPPFPPDATDAMPPPPPPVAPECQTACAHLATICGAQPTECEVTLQKVNDDRTMRAPNGQPVSCACIAAASTKSAMVACGMSCP